MNIIPLRNKVALREVAKDLQSTSGLILMGGTGETPEFGVVAIGPNVTDVKVGDRVYIEIGKSTMIDSGTLVVEDKYIMAVFENE
jgi:co-chaperonin GroES (HSP10)